MTLDPKNIPIKNVSQTTKEQAKQYVATIEPSSPSSLFGPYIDEVYKLSQESGYSAEVIIGQWAVETGAGTSPIWKTRRNPAGIGITDGGDLGYSWPDGTKAAQGQVVHLSGYVDGYNGHLRKYLDQDPRYLTLLKTDYAVSAKVVDDLTGKWATDPEYGKKIAWRIEGLRNTVLTTTPPPVVLDHLTFGRVPRPAIVDRVIPDANNWAWDNLGQRHIYGITYHRMLGTLWGTDGWFRGGGGGSGLTDYGVDCNTGEMLKWNDPYGGGKKGVSKNRAGWASGPWQSPPGDGIALVGKYGVNVINRDLASLEISGNYDTEVGQKGYDAIVALSAHLADAQKVPWTNYPINPFTGLTFTYWHNEFQTEKPCPGNVIMSLTPQIIADTKSLMKRYQVG